MALLLREDDVKRVLTMERAIDAVEGAFRDLARAQAVSFPRQRSIAPGVSLNVLCASSTALDAAGLKCYPIVRQDISVGSSFTVLLYRISTGEMIAVLEANALGQIRTGAASAVATRHLARADSRVMALFGSGWQAESQLEAIGRVVPGLERVIVLGRSPDHTRAFCERMRERLKFATCEIAAGTDVEAALRQADIVTTITGARTPVFDGRWLRPGVHINAAGSNFADKREIDATAVRRADVIVVDDLAVAKAESGDLLAVEDLDWSSIRSLDAVVGGRAPGRTSPSQITLFESHGMGLEDLAVAVCAVGAARAEGIGLDIPLR